MNLLEVSINAIDMFNCIDIHSFIPVRCCVDMDPSALLFPGAYDAVNTARSSDIVFNYK